MIAVRQATHHIRCQTGRYALITLSDVEATVAYEHVDHDIPVTPREACAYIFNRLDDGEEGMVAEDLILDCPHTDSLRPSGEPHGLLRLYECEVCHGKVWQADWLWR